MFSLAPRTPHARLRNENSTHFPSGKAFPKTPLPSAKQILDSTSGKPIAGPTIQLRKALGDKTPGTHLQNRGLKFAVQTPGGKTTVLLEEKPPSASRKSVKRPRISAGFKTPNPATQKPHWDVVDADVSEESIVEEEKEDDDEPEYMPPRAIIPPIDTEYNLLSGAEMGKILNEMAYTPYHLYDDTPISFDEEAFLISDDLLTVPLNALPEESLPFLSDSDSDSEASTEPVHTLTKPSIPPTSKKAPVPTRTRLPITRRTLPPPPAATVRTTKVAGASAAAAIKAATPTATGNGPLKRTVISVPAIAARRKSGTTSALRIPLRNPATGPAAPATRSTRSTKPVGSVNTGVLVRPKVPTAADKGKARAPLLPPAKQQPSPHDDYALRHLPPALRETNELAFDDFRFDV